MLGLVKSDIYKFLRESGGVKRLSDDELIEVCLVMLSTDDMYDDGLAYLQILKSKGICFSSFYNFAKNVWNPKSLVNFTFRAKKNSNISKFTEEFDALAEEAGKAHTSAPRQKGRIFSLLYAYYYDKSKFSDIFLKEVSDLRELVKDKHPLFAGVRPVSEYKLIKKELFGIFCFLEMAYKSNGVVADHNLVTDIIPHYLTPSRGRSRSQSIRKEAGYSDDAYAFLSQSFAEYKNTLILKNPKEADAAFRTLINYIMFQLNIGEIKTLEHFLELIAVGRTGSNRWLHFLEHEVKTRVRSKALTIRDYLLWLMLEHAIDMDDGYEPLLSRLETEKVMRMQVRGTTSGIDETPKALIPYRVHQIAAEILNDETYAWAKSLEYLYFENEFGDKVFNPTLINLFAVLFAIPIRGMQAQCLDSGEGDPYKFNCQKLHWESNDSPNANYWQAKGYSNYQRGFLRRDMNLVNEARKESSVPALGEPVIRSAYMYINTNKTADRNVAFSDNSGYTIPWHNDEIISIVRRQIEFIEKNHKVNKASNFLELDSKDVRQILGADPTEAVKKLIPSRFYLFRCNLNPSAESRNFPPTKALMIKTWNNLMVEIQRQLDEEGADYSVVSPEKKRKFDNNIGGGNSYISYLTIHCTRVTGITRLEEAGLPINIISKFIAGHANLKTTYRYVKHDRAYVNEQINEAQSKISESMKISLTSDLKSSSVEQARTLAFIPDIYSTSWEVIKDRAWNSNTLGICPNAGTLCDEALKSSEFRFNGVGKCLTCKYLISGKPYLITIWSHINSLMYAAKKINNRYVELQSEYRELIKKRKFEFTSNGRSPLWKELNQSIERIENHMESNSDDENFILAEVFYAHSLFEKVRELTNTDDDFVEGLGFEECSDFEHLNSIVESERFIPHFNCDKDLKFKRDTFINMALVALGEQPIFLRPLSDEEREAALSSVAKAIEMDLKSKEGKYLGAAMQIAGLGVSV